MDEMRLKLSTKFMRGMLAKMISRSIRKKHGCKVNMRINEIDLNMIGGETSLHLDVNMELSSDEFKKIMESICED